VRPSIRHRDWRALKQREPAYTLASNAQRIANLESLFARSVEVLGKISDRLAGLKAGQQRIEQTQEFHGTMLAELLALARAGGAVQRAAEEGISEKAVRAVVERLGGEGIEREDLVPWLDNWIAAAARELGRRTNEDEAFELARQEAERRFRAGLKKPSSALMNEFAREEREELKRHEESKRRRVRILEEAVRFDELTLDVGVAIEKLRLIANLTERSEPEDIATYLFDRAGEFCERGDQKGENSALLIAIAAYRDALKERTRERVSLNWAATQNNLGNALWRLGARESGTARLMEAVEAYRDALKEFTRERVPLDWATTQTNLGNALTTLGERESGTARLVEAVEAYRDALKERTHERVPLDWAMTQNNLGAALQTLGARESGTARLMEAVDAFNACLDLAVTTSVWPPEWVRFVQTRCDETRAEIGRRSVK
jgi:tetratricopeptide (TPR) repeat protein